MIPLAKPLLGQQEINAVGKVIRSGWVIEGPKVKEFECQFAAFVGASYAVAVSNCTTALHLSLLVSGVKPGDVVITVSHSFIATANCIRYCQAEPVFVDIDPSTYNMDPAKLEACLKNDFQQRGGRLYYKHIDRLLKNDSPLRYLKKNLGSLSTILVVHQMGMPCDLKSILSIAKKFGLKVVEDAACAIGSEITMDKGKTWRRIGKPHGSLACFSFHPRKIITTGEGGMITTSDERIANRLRLLRCHGRNIPAFEQRTTLKKVRIEDYVITGYNYRMTDIQAAIGLAQLQRLEMIVKERRRLDALYRKHFFGIKNVILPFKPDVVKTNWQSYPVRLKGISASKRNCLIQELLRQGISSQPGVTNAHTQPPYRNNRILLAQSEDARKEVIILPLYVGLKEADIKKVALIVSKI